VVTVHAARVTTQAIVDALEGTGLPVGSGEKPAGAGWQGAPGQSTFKGYVVVHPIGGGVDGPIGDWVADVQARYQLTSVGATQSQCENIADLCAARLLNSPISIVGRTVALVTIDDVGVVRRDDTVIPSVWINPRAYRLLITPT